MTRKMRSVIIFLLVVIVTGCSKTLFNSKWVSEKAPANFVARFETSKGSFDVEINREWSPMAVDRVYQLLRHRFYDNSFFWRVVPDFVAQFGSGDTAINRKWSKFKVPDEKVLYGNKKGSISFARGGKDSRGNALFINLTDNSRLDTISYNGVTGFPAFGKVTRGMEVVDALYSGYGDSTMKAPVQYLLNRQLFLKSFPKLDSIRKAYILKTQ